MPDRHTHTQTHTQLIWAEPSLERFGDKLLFDLRDTRAMNYHFISIILSLVYKKTSEKNTSLIPFITNISSFDNYNSGYISYLIIFVCPHSLKKIRFYSRAISKFPTLNNVVMFCVFLVLYFKLQVYVPQSSQVVL